MRIHPLVVAQIRKAHADALLKAEHLSSRRTVLPGAPAFHNQAIRLNKELHEANAIAQSWEAVLNAPDGIEGDDLPF